MFLKNELEILSEVSMEFALNLTSHGAEVEVTFNIMLLAQLQCGLKFGLG